MTDFDIREQDALSEIDELLELMDEDSELDDEDILEETEDITDDGDEYQDDEDQDDEEDEDEEDDSENPLSIFAERVREVCTTVSDMTYQAYTEPDEKTLVKPKTSIITIASCTVAFIAIAVVAYFFFTSFNYYTTGVTIDEFIERFNGFEITSDSDIYQIIPSYTDVIIPEDAKLSGSNTIELMDGHVVIEANTRFGKIVDITVRNVDYPGYDPEVYYFDTSDGSTDYLYYYVCLGKAIAAFQPEIATVYDATYSAYQMHQYAYIYMLYGQGGHYSVEVNGNIIAYDLVDACVTVEPAQRTITSAVWPEWLQPDEDVVIPDTEETGIDSETSGTDTTSSADAQ